MRERSIVRTSDTQRTAMPMYRASVSKPGISMTFRAPRPDGTPSTWRVHIDETAVEPQSNERQPFKGTLRSSWYVNGEKIEITGRDSNLPIELTSNGLSQECWAFWEANERRWSWE